MNILDASSSSIYAIHMNTTMFSNKKRDSKSLCRDFRMIQLDLLE